MRPRKWITQAEFARLFNVSEEAIRQAIKTGKIDRAKKGGVWKINKETEGVKFANCSRSLLDREQSEDARTIASKPAGVNSPGETEQEITPYNSRQQQELYKALKARLDYQKEKGKVVDVEEAKARWQGVAVAVRKYILNIPDRLAPLVAAENDARACWAILDKECRNILEDLADDVGRNDQ